MKRKPNPVIIIGLILGGIFGSTLAIAMMPLETEIKTNPEITKSIKQSDGPYTLTYHTTGTTVTRFILGCTSNGLYTFSNMPNCIVLNTDGEKGTIDVAIPNVIVEALEDPKIGDVNNGFYKGLSFQILSVDESYTLTRIDVPEKEHVIAIIGYSPKKIDPVAHAFAFGIGVFLLVIVVGLAIEEKRERIRRKREAQRQLPKGWR